MKKIKKSKENFSATLTEMIAVKKGYAEFVDENNVEKAIDTPASFRIGGVLAPEEIDSLIPILQDRSQFLKSITVLNLKRTTANLNDYNVSERGMRRPGAWGTLPSDTTTNVSNAGNKITLEELQEFYLQKDSVLQDNVDTPNFQNYIMDKLTTAWSNDLADLVWAGTDTTGAGFTTLMKGFPTLFATNASVHDVVYADQSDILALMDALWLASPEKYKKAPDMAYILTEEDYSKLWSLYQSGNSTGLAWKESDAQMMYKGRPVLWFNYMPDNKAYLTPLKNLVLALGSGKSDMNIVTKDMPEFAGEGIFLNFMGTVGVFNYDAVTMAS